MPPKTTMPVVYADGKATYMNATTVEATSMKTSGKTAPVEATSVEAASVKAPSHVADVLGRRRRHCEKDCGKRDPCPKNFQQSKSLHCKFPHTAVPN
jgi:hypothetical protein